MPEEVERNLEHKRATYAYNCIDEISSLGDGGLEKQYKSAVLSCGALIHKAGLLQALSFYISKQKDHYKLLAKHILEGIESGPANLENINQLLCLDDMAIAYKTTEANALIIWLKRFADGRLKGQDDIVAGEMPEAGTEET